MSQQPYIKRPLVLDSVDNSMHARDYQIAGVDFLYNGHPNNPLGFNAFLGDQMRLGKTNQFLLAAASAKKNGDDRFPMLIVLKPANIFQWAREIKKWYSKSNLSCFTSFPHRTDSSPMELICISFQWISLDVRDAVNHVVTSQSVTRIVPGDAI